MVTLLQRSARILPALWPPRTQCTCRLVLYSLNPSRSLTRPRICSCRPLSHAMLAKRRSQCSLLRPCRFQGCCQPKPCHLRARLLRTTPCSSQDSLTNLADTETQGEVEMKRKSSQRTTPATRCIPPVSRAPATPSTPAAPPATPAAAPTPRGPSPRHKSQILQAFTCKSSTRTTNH